MPALQKMEQVGLLLLVHGESTDQSVDVFEREQSFYETVMPMSLSCRGLGFCHHAPVRFSPFVMLVLNVHMCLLNAIVVQGPCSKQARTKCVRIIELSRIQAYQHYMHPSGQHAVDLFVPLRGSWADAPSCGWYANTSPPQLRQPLWRRHPFQVGFKAKPYFWGFPILTQPKCLLFAPFL